MKTLIKMGKLIVLSLIFLASNQVFAGTFNLSSYAWAYDYDQDGNIDDDEVISNDSLDFSGYSLVAITTDDDSNETTFTDYTYLKNTTFGIYSVSTLVGTVNDAWSLATFSSSESSMTWYAENGTEILTVSVESGDSLLNVSGTTLTIGQIYLTLDVTYVAKGYFYIYIDGEWVDLADLVSDENSNDNDVTFNVLTDSGVPLNALDSDYSTALEKYIKDETGTTVDLSSYVTDKKGTDKVDLSQALQSDGSYVYVTSNDGSVDINSSAYQAPEPGMLSLMGLAFLGLAGLQRHRKINRS